jgi:hypothetical protein
MNFKLSLFGKKDEEYYFRNGIILDTKPFLFYLAGRYDFDSIGKTPLTEEYRKEDFEILNDFISKFKRIVITPQILAEVSNIINTKIPKNNFVIFINKIIKILLDAEEMYINKNDILKREEIKLGITDVSILTLCERSDQIILTKDLVFANLCLDKGLPIIHFDWLRSLYWSQDV